MSADIHWRKIHKRTNDRFLFAEDIGPPGSAVDVEVTGSGVDVMKSVDGDKPMPWVGFKGKQKVLGLNKTNCATMERLCGTPLVNKWRGAITLLVIRTKITDRTSGDRVETDAIRISPKRPKAASNDNKPVANDNKVDGNGAPQD